MPKTGSNDPCLCISTKKYKKCCMLIDEMAKCSVSVNPREGNPIEPGKLRRLADISRIDTSYPP